MGRGGEAGAPAVGIETVGADRARGGIQRGAMGVDGVVGHEDQPPRAVVAVADVTGDGGVTDVEVGDVRGAGDYRGAVEPGCRARVLGANPALGVVDDRPGHPRLVGHTLDVAPRVFMLTP